MGAVLAAAALSRWLDSADFSGADAQALLALRRLHYELLASESTRMEFTMRRSHNLCQVTPPPLGQLTEPWSTSSVDLTPSLN